MKKSLFILILCLIFALSACGRQEAGPEAPVISVPAGILLEPPAAQPPEGPESDLPPSSLSWGHYMPALSLTAPGEEGLRHDQIHERREGQQAVRSFLQAKLTHGETVTGVDPIGEDLWLAIGYRMTEKGVLDPFRLRAEVTSDGKYFTLKSLDELPQDRVWNAIQSYAFVMSSINRDWDAFLSLMGFSDYSSASINGGGWRITDLSYAKVKSAAFRYMTPQLFDTYLGGCGLQQQDGMTKFFSTGGGSSLYSVTEVRPLADGSYLAYGFHYTGECGREDWISRVELEARPAGGYRVSSWRPGEGEELLPLWTQAGRPTDLSDLSDLSDGLLWEYAPLLSSRYPAMPFTFRLPGQEVTVTCDAGVLIDYDHFDEAEKSYPQGQALGIRAGETLYWSPWSGDSTAATARVTFSVLDEAGAPLYQGALSIAQEETSPGVFYRVRLEDAPGLALIQDESQPGGVLVAVSD